MVEVLTRIIPNSVKASQVYLSVGSMLIGATAPLLCGFITSLTDNTKKHSSLKNEFTTELCALKVLISQAQADNNVRFAKIDNAISALDIKVDNAIGALDAKIDNAISAISCLRQDLGGVKATLDFVEKTKAVLNCAVIGAFLYALYTRR
ncbi:hypothetical protein CHLNCDRAFT_139430 [Chlorella variabilis]|uniref:Uncharacterized protein n=1 Tax=Chlorella variabilis TaxID=554065 RepID=E1ZPS7_CHLVA|nr:hypothetical protein CHLNCDRAFT_139430 [Chlorella variabilis]EFN52117.1 hypothetical protein CHLNCDRAFT_139430 [Chlorella variabilis]|eukprot:XP_005844219.1 hypothetical protein CHLNCDRAFT_139430 [Chlorella variabilis]